MTLVNDPLSSCDAVSQYVKRAPRYSEKRERKRFKAMATLANNSCKISQNDSNMVEECPVCNKNHDIEDFTYYLQQAMKERSKFLF